MAGRYRPEDWQGLDVNIVRDYCMEMSVRSLKDIRLETSLAGDRR